MNNTRNLIQLILATIFLLVLGLLFAFLIYITTILWLIGALAFMVPLFIALIKYRKNPKIPLQINGYFLLVMLLTALLVISVSGGKHLFGKSGKLHINVLLPQEAVAHWVPPPDYYGRIINVIDANSVSSGNMVFSIILPGDKEVFVTKQGEMALQSILKEEEEQIAKGKAWKMIFDVHEDTFRDKLRWAYIQWRGSAAGCPESARGKPEK